MIEAKTLCQSCIERGLEPKEAIGLWQSMPICDDCLKPLIENRNEGIPPAENQVDIKVEEAIQFVEQLEILFDKFPIASEMVLRSHDDFYNHRALANVNIPADILEKIIDQRKSIIFALNRRNEPDVLRFQQIKREEREKAGIVGIDKSKKENKKLPPSAAKEAQIKKIAKQLNMSYEAAEKMMQAGREKEFAGVLRNDIQSTKSKQVGERETTKGILEGIKEQIKASEGSRSNQVSPTSASSISGTGRCPNCKRFTCVC